MRGQPMTNVTKQAQLGINKDGYLTNACGAASLPIMECQSALGLVRWDDAHLHMTSCVCHNRTGRGGKER